MENSMLKITATSLGNDEFKSDYNLKYAYIAGAMYRGISSVDMVVNLGKAGMMGFFGTGGLELRQIEDAILRIQKELANNQAYGMNLIYNPNMPEKEEQAVELFIRHGVQNIEASAYMTMTLGLVRLRAEGLKRNSNGSISGSNRIIAKISRPEVAKAFLSPAPEYIVEQLVIENKISIEQAELLREIPVAEDLCVESDSGGHTDGRVAYTLMPTMFRLRDEMMSKYKYRKKVRIGAAGGIGAPEAAAAAFVMGADFIVTGSINHCTVEAGTSDRVKDMLHKMNVQDTEYTPAGDMFEIGAKVQVLKKGLFFSARANKLYDIYRFYNSLDEIDEKNRILIQEKYFKRSFEEVFDEIKGHLSLLDREKAEKNPKYKMALIFKWYFRYSTILALEGNNEHQVDYQVPCGPALGALNQWLKGTNFENWKNRHVDEIGKKIMVDTAEFLRQRIKSLLD